MASIEGLGASSYPWRYDEHDLSGGDVTPENEEPISEAEITSGKYMVVEDLVNGGLILVPIE